MAGDTAYHSDLPPFQPHKLYYQVIPKRFLRVVTSIMPLFGKDPRRFGRNGDIDLTALVRDGDFPTHAHINYSEVAAIKDEATLCHTSQLGGPSLRRGPMRWMQYIFGQHEYYMRAYPPANGRLREQDLFD
jgi:hypothetical protein